MVEVGSMMTEDVMVVMVVGVTEGMIVIEAMVDGMVEVVVMIEIETEMIGMINVVDMTTTKPLCLMNIMT